MRADGRGRSSATLHDVAARAGVSVATASRVLTGARRTDSELAARVREAAEYLGYRRNSIAAALRQARTDTVGMVVPAISNPFFPSLVEAVERELQTSGRELFLCDSQNDVAIERRRVQALLDRQVDGILLIPVSTSKSVRTVKDAATQLPLVLVDREIEDAPVACVRVDDAAGVGQVVQHLTELGTGRAAFVSAGLEISSARARHDAFYELAARAGIELDPPLLGDFSASWGAEAAKRLAANRAVDAVFCANDEIALGLLTAFRAQHVKVPEDVAVIGFDDTPAASLCVPSLTTVQQPTEAIATRAIEALGADPPETGTRTLEPLLIVRGSTTAQAVTAGSSSTR